MGGPPISMILTVHDRPAEVSRQVAESLKLEGNDAEELILVLDRPTNEARASALDAYSSVPMPVRSIEISGEPGWKCPAAAWNTGFQAANNPLLYCISSEVVQDAGNVRKARALCGDLDRAVFGSCDNSIKAQLVTGAPPGVLVNSSMARPLGFIVAMPAENVDEIGGFDEEFMKGLWYDDDDFFLRLWRSGLDFQFNDSIHGIHLDHDRPVLNSPEGQAAVKINQAHMLNKHGSVYPWIDLIRIEKRTEGDLIWGHV
jgi:GT2 family glycosyltransferase